MVFLYCLTNVRNFTYNLLFSLEDLLTYFLKNKGCYHLLLFTQVILQPVTGRRHQLRIHCHAIGHTIVGDYVYSDGQDTKPHR